jgi:5'-nucleotidase
VEHRVPTRDTAAVPDASPKISRRALVATGVAIVLVAAVGVALEVHRVGNSGPVAGGAPVPVRVIAFNDLHGNLEPPAGSSGKVQQGGGVSVDAGGAAFLATKVAQLRAQAKNSVLVSAGDNIGASPVASALFHDEPTIDVLDELGVTASAVGNHEFDEGFAELQRMQKGGCHPTDGCVFRPDFPGATFPILGANVTDANGAPALPASTVVEVGGVKLGIIGATLHDLPSVVTPEAIKGLQFGDEVAAIDKASAELTKQGVNAQIVVVHQGDEGTGGGPSDCSVEPNGPATAIATKVSPAVDAVFSGHSHQQYVCTVTDPAGAKRPLVQGLSFGRLLSVVDLVVDPGTGDVVRDSTTARNEVVGRDATPDPAVEKIVDEAKEKSAPIANRPVGSITADLVRSGGATGESSLGDVIADAQLEATRATGAQLAITNPGGIRADIQFAPDGVVTYGEAFRLQPFANIMQTISLTGAQLKAVLEQQWQGQQSPKILQISSTLHYSYSQAAQPGSKITAISVAGTAVDPAARYRVAVNNFLAAGGDNFTTFAQGTDLQGGPIDLDALLDYLKAHPNLAPPPADRITTTP